MTTWSICLAKRLSVVDRVLRSQTTSDKSESTLPVGGGGDMGGGTGGDGDELC